jgi:Arc/MetJ-type ribon-helix-helix transcriptional regulator
MEPLPKISFCLTTEELKTVDELRARLGRKGLLHNRSEVIRAAIRAMSKLRDSDLRAGVESVPKLKPGRARDKKRGQ